ncbi:MAG: SDR family NAD(P)-dependent oxidoreductase [Gemmataceae bacterium]
MAIAGRDAAKLDAAAKSLAAGDRLIVKACDVTEKEQVHALVDDVTKGARPDRHPVNNAGANVKNRAVRDLDEATWDHPDPRQPRWGVLRPVCRVAADAPARTV